MNDEKGPEFKLGDGFKSSADRIDGERELRLANGKRRIPFGVKYLDRSLGGMMPNDLVLLGAKTGVGKTDLATIVALHNVMNGKRVHYFALEAEDLEIERRMKFKLLTNLFFKEAADKRAAERISYLDWHAGDLDDVLGVFEPRADKALKIALKNLYTLYRKRDFFAEDFERDLLAVQDNTDLVILDHIHFVDSTDSNENRGFKKIIKQIRDAAIDVGKPVIVVAHMRKGDKRNDSLVPSTDDFMGTSDIPKMATKAITLTPAFDQENEVPYLWNTYMAVSKCRTEGARARYVALTVFNSRKNIYEDDFTLGKLVDGGKRFEELGLKQLPYWARP